MVPETVVPEAVELGAAEAELGAAEAEVVALGLVLPAADEVEVLLQAAASIATAASGRP